MAPPEDKRKQWKNLRNKIPNLQLLEGSDNESKNSSSLSKWIEEGNNVAYSDTTESTDLYNFEKYYKQRKINMKNKLKEIFQIK